MRFKIVAQLIFPLLQHYKDTDIGVWSLGTIQTITLVISQWSVLLIETRSWVGIRLLQSCVHFYIRHCPEIKISCEIKL